MTSSTSNPRDIQTPSPGRKDERDARWEGSMAWRAYALISLFFLPVMILILRDRRVWPWDEAFYGEYSVWLFRTLIHSPLNWPAAMLSALGDRAPAISWFGQIFVPVGYALPFVQSGLLLYLLLTQVVTIVILYRLLFKVFEKNLAALITCCIAASGSLFVALTYHYFVEPLQLFSVVWLLALAADRKRLGRPILAIHAVAAFAFGLLVKTSTPLFQFPVLLYLIYVWVRKKPEPATRPSIWESRTFLYASVVGCVLIVSGTFAWYFNNFDATWKHVLEASSGDLALYYGSKGDLSTKLSFWVVQCQRSFLYFPILAVIVLMLPTAFMARFKKRVGMTEADSFAVLSIVWIAAILLIFSRNINQETRYLLALLPYISVVICWIASNCRSRLLLLALGATSVVQITVVSAQSYGVLSPREGLNGWLRAYVRDPEALQDSMFCAARTADVSVEHPGIVGVELPEFNEVGLSFYAAVLGHPVEPGKWFFNGFDWTKSDVDAAWPRVEQINARYVIFRRHDSSLDVDPINHLAAPVLAKVVNSSQFRLRSDKSNERVLVYERMAVQHPQSQSDTKAELYGVMYRGFQGSNPEAKLPFGLLEYPTSGLSVQRANHLVSLGGWAVSPNGVASVEVLLDNQHIADAVQSKRPDVQTAYPKFGSTGFTSAVELGVVTDGAHRISIKVHSKDGSAKVISDISILNRLDFAGVNPEGTGPFGLLEYPNSADIIDPRNPLLFGGWTVAQSGIKHVDLLLDGRRIAQALTKNRPDVAKAYPAFKSSGFSASVDPTLVPKGSHRLSVVSHSLSGTSRLIAQVTVVRR